MSPMSPPHRLSSPIHLSPVTPIASRTRSKAAAQSRRRRLPASHAFDDLPWIATLDAEPELLNPWDIADLSLIADSFSDPLSSSGPGPVRRRKTSLRSSPITSAKIHSPLPRDISIPPPQFVSTTPRSRFIPSRVLFHDLMPVVSCDFSPERSHSCITRSRINF